jgi:hypothetical protein
MRVQSLLCAQYFTGNQKACALFYVINRVTFEQYDVGQMVRKEKNLFRKRMYCAVCTVQFFSCRRQ